MMFLTNLGVKYCTVLRLVLEGKADKEMPGSLRLEFLEKFLVNNFTLSDVEDNTSGPLSRVSMADLSIQFAKSQESQVSGK